MAWDDEVAAAMVQVFDKEAGVGTSVTLRQVTAGAFNSATGVRATTTSDTTVGALRGPSTTRVTDASGRLTETRRYSMKVAELSGVTPRADDKVIDGGVTWMVMAVSRSAEGAVWELDCVRSAA